MNFLAMVVYAGIKRRTERAGRGAVELNTSLWCHATSLGTGGCCGWWAADGGRRAVGSGQWWSLVTGHWGERGRLSVGRRRAIEWKAPRPAPSQDFDFGDGPWKPDQGQGNMPFRESDQGRQGHGKGECFAGESPAGAQKCPRCG